MISGCSPAAAGDDTANAAAEAANAHQDPGDHVVDPHEVAGLILVDVALLDLVDPVILVDLSGHDISRSERAALTKSPDHAGDPPGHVAALEAAENGWAAWDADEECGAEDTALVDEAPHEPGHEVVVDVVEVSDGVGDCGSPSVKARLGVHDLLSVDNTVPAVAVGVVHGELTEVDGECDQNSAHSQSADAGADLGAEASALQLLLVGVHDEEELFRILLIMAEFSDAPLIASRSSAY